MILILQLPEVQLIVAKKYVQTEIIVSESPTTCQAG